MIADSGVKRKCVVDGQKSDGGDEGTNESIVMETGEQVSGGRTAFTISATAWILSAHRSSAFPAGLQPLHSTDAMPTKREETLRVVEATIESKKLSMRITLYFFHLSPPPHSNVD